MKYYMFLLIAIILEILGTSALKTTQQFTKLFPSVLTVISYAGAFYFLSLTLKVLPVGIAYALWSGIGIIFISLAGWLLFDQSLDLPSIIGLGLIIIGVVVINVFSKSTIH